MLIEALNELFKRDLLKLKNEIGFYKSETTLWEVENSIKNSSGNLCLHLIGNLNTYIGNGISNIGYVRDREFEFAGKSVSRAELHKQIDETIAVVDNALRSLSQEQLQDNFPMLIWEEETGMAFTLIHLHSHLNYHLGQINYHRKLLDI